MLGAAGGRPVGYVGRRRAVGHGGPADPRSAAPSRPRRRARRGRALLRRRETRRGRAGACVHGCDRVGAARCRARRAHSVHAARDRDRLPGRGARAPLDRTGGLRAGGQRVRNDGEARDQAARNRRSRGKSRTVRPDAGALGLSGDVSRCGDKPARRTLHFLQGLSGSGYRLGPSARLVFPQCAGIAPFQRCRRISART
ncbi:hypothetical protein F01_440047 [Burkholderia cenocepacia]|nr:hypothetical protein F01_440047 [Burkholderia cenocepacia]